MKHILIGLDALRTSFDGSVRVGSKLRAGGVLSTWDLPLFLLLYSKEIRMYYRFSLNSMNWKIFFEVSNSEFFMIMKINYFYLETPGRP